MANTDEILSIYQITDDEIQEFRQNDIGLNGIDIARVSYLLSAQLASARKYRIFSTFSVTDIIQRLEGRYPPSSMIKNPEQFKHPPLKGLWKAHFFDAIFMLQNLNNETGSGIPNSKRFQAICQLVAKKVRESNGQLSWQMQLAHELTVGAYERRARNKRITGEWLIFSKKEQANFYLAISNHTHGEQDYKLYNYLVDYCKEEYPFIFE